MIEGYLKTIGVLMKNDKDLVSLSTTVFTNNGKKYVPFIRMLGELDEPLIERKYIFFSSFPAVDKLLTLRDIAYILDDSSSINVAGIWLIDSISTAVFLISKKELKNYLNKYGEN